MHLHPHPYSPYGLHMASPDNVSAGTYSALHQTSDPQPSHPLFMLHLVFLLCILAGWRGNTCARFYPSHFNVLSIQSGPPAMTDKPLCRQAKVGRCPHPWSLVSAKFRRANLRGQRWAEQGVPLPFKCWVSLKRETQDDVGFINFLLVIFGKLKLLQGEGAAPGAPWGTLLAEPDTCQIPPCFWHIGSKKAEGPIYTLKWTVSRQIR